MKLIIQIPCYNEAEYLPLTLKDLPKEIKGIDKIEVLIVDDGSSDGTAEVARKNGVDHIVRFKTHRGLAAAFSAGLEACLLLGADIIINTDADNQYSGQDIPKLIEPILSGEADIVVGDRQTQTIPHFSWTKKKFQKWGSRLVKILSKTKIPDATSGFRAISKEAALKMNVLSDFSYTLETLIQAGKMRFAVKSVPISTNVQTRKSRLFNNMFTFLKNSASTILRTYAMHEPLKIFLALAALFFIGGVIPGIRFLIFFFSGNPGGHIQSLILSAVLLIISFLLVVVAILSDLISSNRKLIEETLWRIRRMESKKAEKDSSD
ncbi:MAG: glycosyltransferase family 2 protein [Candidatus Aminicenantes bacterium]|nr:MAG: glycosyltransferase family 2 protein [Candidatus Aminicenantes bacterium]